MARIIKSVARILVVDDDKDILFAADLLLRRHFASVEVLCSPSTLPDRIRQGTFDVLLLDMNFVAGADDGAEGLRLLSHLLTLDPLAVVVIVTAHGDIELAVEAMKKGAADFVIKPWANDRLVATLSAAFNLRRSRIEAAGTRNRSVAATHTDMKMLGTSKSMLRVFETIRRAAPTDANVLILGENGTGKELVAREIHRLSRRAREVFLRVDLGSLSPHVFESELFGHRRGAFTDARTDRTGLFRAARGGTLFLDEIGNVPLALQSKLLTALERHEVTPVGSDTAEPIDVRILSATNNTVAHLADETRFRQDLLYRINTVEVALPPLRERQEDIAILLTHYIAIYSDKYNLPPRALSSAALEGLLRHSWAGNVRELSHAVERALILSEGHTLAISDFSLLSEGPDSSRKASSDFTTLDSIERDAIQKALTEHKGNISRAATALGVTRASLYRRIQKYGL